MMADIRKKAQKAKGPSFEVLDVSEAEKAKQEKIEKIIAARGQNQLPDERPIKSALPPKQQ